MTPTRCILGYDPAHHSPAAPVNPLNGVGSYWPPSSHTWPWPSSPPLVEPRPSESSVGTYSGDGCGCAAPAGPPVQTGPEARYGRFDHIEAGADVAERLERRRFEHVEQQTGEAVPASLPVLYPGPLAAHNAAQLTSWYQA